jgi:glutamyl-tRNA synthetase
MIFNEKGKKLSKRDGAMDVLEYKKMGFLPEALLNFLVRLGWSYQDQEIFTLEEMKKSFSPFEINKSPSAYNFSKLLWLNSHYIKNSPNEKLEDLIEERGVKVKNHDKKEILIDALKERAKTIEEMAAMAREILDRPVEYDAKAVKKVAKGNFEVLLNKIAEKLAHSLAHFPIQYHEIVEEVVKEEKVGFGKVAQPLRVALIGKLSGPDLGDIMSILGKDEVISRINNFLIFLR